MKILGYVAFSVGLFATFYGGMHGLLEYCQSSRAGVNQATSPKATYPGLKAGFVPPPPIWNDDAPSPIVGVQTDL